MVFVLKTRYTGIHGLLWFNTNNIYICHYVWWFLFSWCLMFLFRQTTVFTMVCSLFFPTFFFINFKILFWGLYCVWYPGKLPNILTIVKALIVFLVIVNFSHANVPWTFISPCNNGIFSCWMLARMLIHQGSLSWKKSKGVKKHQFFLQNLWRLDTL